MITIYLLGRGYKLAPIMALLPGTWYAFIIFTYICNAKIGFNIPMTKSYILGAVFALVYFVMVYRQGIKVRNSKIPLEAAPVYEEKSCNTAPQKNLAEFAHQVSGE